MERAIQEEIDRVKKHGMVSSPEVPQAAEPVRKDAEAASEPRETAEPEEVKALRQEVMDLKITNKAKDMFIDQLRNEREGLIHQAVESSRKVVSGKRDSGAGFREAKCCKEEYNVLGKRSDHLITYTLQLRGFICIGSRGTGDTSSGDESGRYPNSINTQNGVARASLNRPPSNQKPTSRTIAPA